MMNDVKIPEKPGFVADAVKNIISKVVGKEQYHPRPPRLSREFVWSYRISKGIYSRDKQAEYEAESDADKSDQNIIPRIFRKISIRIFSARIPRLNRDKQGKNRNGNDDGI